MRTRLRDQILAAFDPTAGTRIEALNKDTELYRVGKEVESLFTEAVLSLQAIPEPLRSLGSAMRDIFHHRHVVVTVGVQVPTLSFVVVSPPAAMIFAPPEWPEMSRKNPTYQRGAVVFCGSQAVDYYNGRYAVDPSSLILKRAHSYEAEYLRALKPEAGTLNEHQRWLLKTFPRFRPSLLYKRKQVTPKN